MFGGYNFEWDPEKAEANLSKHGVSFEEAVTAFGDPLSMNMPDPDHSKGNNGSSFSACQIVFACWSCPTPRGKPRTRIISARLATRYERKQYEQE